jgi:cytochrome c oxidase cbb3-type subunit 3
MIRMWIFNADDLFQEREFEAEMAEAASKMPAAPAAGEFEIKLLNDAASIASGKEIYGKICQVCHLVDGGGLVGPNFTDNYWIHGNTIEDWYGVVTNGVLEKGMIAYKDQLSPKQRLEVLSYIATLHGTTPANPKAPEGEEMEWLY